MKNNKSKWLFAFVAFSIAALISTYYFQQKQSCLLTRGAFDIGSGTTKMKIAVVNICEHSIEQELLSHDLPVGYRESLKLNQNKINQEIIELGIRSIEELKQMSKWKVDQWYGVATSAFRTSDNGEEALELMAQKTQLNLKVITQKEEALLALESAKAKLPKSQRNRLPIMVWDIGGGSMQILIKEENSSSFFLSTTASVGFKEKVIEKILLKDPKLLKSPNPISTENTMPALELARSIALSEVEATILEKIKRSPFVIGVGGVHYYSIREQLSSDEYSSDQIIEKLKLRSALSDDQIQGNYKDTEISNLALVAGYMQALHIKSVKTVNANLADALLLSGFEALKE